MGEVTGEAAGEIRQLVPDIETLARRLADVDYLVDEGLATSMFLSLRLPQPLLLEGEAGVGKTEAAKSLALVLEHAAGPPAVLRGDRRGGGAVRVELPAPAPEHPPRGLAGDGARRGGAVRPGLPDPAPAPACARASRPATCGAADRRDRPGRRRLRGVPARAARRGQRDDSRDRHDPGHASADHRADVEPDARPARRRQAALPVPRDLVPEPAARGRDRAAPRQGRIGDAGGPGRERGLPHARERRAEASRRRRGDRLARGAEPARRREAGRGGDRSDARVGVEVQRGPGGGSRGWSRAARARR